MNLAKTLGRTYLQLAVLMEKALCIYKIEESSENEFTFNNQDSPEYKNPKRICNSITNNHKLNKTYKFHSHSIII